MNGTLRRRRRSSAAALLASALLLAPSRPAAAAQDPAGVGVVRDLTYHASEPAAAGATELDLYFPRGGREGRLPIVVFVHGGGWRAGTRSAHAEKGRHFARAGFLFTSVDYRLHPAVDVATQAHDVARAISWVARNAEPYDADPTRVFLIGHSAGAHLAALVAVDPVYLTEARFPRDHLRGVVLLDGAGYDLLDVGDGPRIAGLYRTVFGDDPDARRAVSPVHRITGEALPPPFLILHVPREGSRAASEALGRRLREVGGEARVVETPGKTHQTINRELGAAGDEVTALVDAFLAQR